MPANVAREIVQNCPASAGGPEKLHIGRRQISGECANLAGNESCIVSREILLVHSNAEFVERLRSQDSRVGKGEAAVLAWVGESVEGHQIGGHHILIEDCVTDEEAVFGIRSEVESPLKNVLAVLAVVAAAMEPAVDFIGQGFGRQRQQIDELTIGWVVGNHLLAEQRCGNDSRDLLSASLPCAFPAAEEEQLFFDNGAPCGSTELVETQFVFRSCKEV